MSHQPNLVRDQLLNDPEFQAQKKALLATIHKHSESARSIHKTTSDAIREEYAKSLKHLSDMRGRPGYFPFLSSGIGAGPFVELTDGSRKLDLITGIGINFFGHSHPELMSELVDGMTSDTMQGNLMPGFEAEEISTKLLSLVGKESRLKHVSLFCSGTMANETALKIIRQSKFPASRIFAFEDCFAGRSTAMQEITDSPGYRDGQPTYGEVCYLPYYNEKWGVDRSVDLAVSHMQWEMKRHPKKYAGLMIELIQGEGGFRYAPREYYVKLFEAAQKAGLAIWADEIQTFGRTTELFAYQTFGLEKYIDVVTVGKLLHACATLHTTEICPRPGLVAGTFTGSFASLKTGRRILEILSEQGYYGKDGKIAKLSHHFESGLEKLKNGSCKGRIGVIRAIGGMVGFEVFDGSADRTKAFLMKLFDAGVVAFTAGHGPYIVRCLPPFGVMKESEIDLALGIIETCLLAENA